MDSFDEESQLSQYFDQVYETLSERGVPEDRMPSPWLILSHVIEALDYDSFSEWVDAYASLEAVEDPPQDNSPSGSKPKRPRPSYLRVLNPPEPEPETD